MLNGQLLLRLDVLMESFVSWSLTKPAKVMTCSTQARRNECGQEID